MKTLKFDRSLVELIKNGEKRTTWRLFDEKNITTRDSLTLESGGRVFAKAEVTSVVEKRFKELDDNDWEGHEKFNSDTEMYERYTYYYNQTVNEDIIVKIIKFEILEFVD